MKSKHLLCVDFSLNRIYIYTVNKKTNTPEFEDFVTQNLFYRDMVVSAVMEYIQSYVHSYSYCTEV